MKCLVKGCRKNAYCDAGLVTFHSIPKQSHRLWCEILNIDVEWKPSLKVCSLHFAENDFYASGKSIRLRAGVVPSLALDCDAPQPESTESIPGPSHANDEAIEYESAERAKDADKKPTQYECSEPTAGPSHASDEGIILRQMSSSSPTTSEEGNTFKLPQTSDSGSQSKKRKRPTSHQSTSSGKSSSSERSKEKRRKMISMMHNYSALHTPRKAMRTEKLKTTKYRTRLYRSKQTITRLRRKIVSLKNIISQLGQQRKISEHAEEHLNTAFGHLSHTLLQGERRRVREYPQEIKEFAMTLQFYSTKAYEYVRTQFNFNLPHVATIRRWFSGVDCTPGFTEQAFIVLKEKADHDPSKRIFCSLMLDEMALKKQIQFDGKRTWGYVDIGAGMADDSLSPASEVLVLMVVALHDSWKLPIAYFFIKSLTGAERCNIVKEALVRLKEYNVEITSVTCDGPSVHFTMLNGLGCEITSLNTIIKTYFPHPADDSRVVYALLDICHMLKLMRNCLASSGAILDPDGNKIEWKFIERLHQLQEQEGLSLGNKLRKAHIQWQRQKMKVKLAGQTLSRSVADALEFLAGIGHPEFVGCEATIRFITIIDQLFDICNSRSPCAKGFKGPLRQNTEEKWRPFLTDCVDYLKNCRAVDGTLMINTPKKTPFIGFIVSTLSIIGIFDTYVKNTPALKYLLTYKLSQDHLETFFCSVRSRNGWSNNPTCLAFMHIYKRLLIHGAIKGIGGNCTPLDLTSILHLGSEKRSYIRRNQTVGFNVDVSILRKYGMDVDPQLEEHDYSTSHIPTLDGIIENCVHYMCGYVVKMAAKRIHCADCLNVLYDTEKQAIASSVLLGCKDRGGLIWPSQGVITVALQCEKYVRLMLQVTDQKMPPEEAYMETAVNHIASQFYNKEIFPDLKDHFFDMDFMSNHVYILLKTLSFCYLKIRLFNLSKKHTEVIAAPQSRQLLSKLILFSHL